MKIGQAILYLVAGVTLLICAIPAVLVAWFVVWSAGPMVIRLAFPDFWYTGVQYAVTDGRTVEEGSAVFRCRRKSFTGPYEPGWHFFHGPDNAVMAHKFNDGSVVLFKLDPARLCVKSGSQQLAMNEGVKEIAVMTDPADLGHIRRCRTMLSDEGQEIVDPDCPLAVRSVALSRIGSAPPTKPELIVPSLWQKDHWMPVRNMSVAVAGRDVWQEQPDLASELGDVRAPIPLGKINAKMSPEPWETQEFGRLPFRQVPVTVGNGEIQIHADAGIGTMQPYAAATVPWKDMAVRLDGRILTDVPGDGSAFDPVSGLIILFAVDPVPVEPLFAVPATRRTSFVDLYSLPAAE